MHFFLTVLIFITILFLYIHIIDQYKKSEDLEIYEMDYSTNKQLQEVCNVKQPILFQFSIPSLENLTFSNILEKGSAADVNVKDVNDYFIDPPPVSVDPIGLSFKSFQGLVNTDTKSHYFTENNSDYIDETGLYKQIVEVNDFFKPDFSVQTRYDILSGSKNCITPLRHHTNYRDFYIVTAGKIRVKMTPWRSRKHLHSITDYENYEFWSPVNVFNTQPRYISDMEKLKFLEFDVSAGQVLYIPPYWWHSIKFIEVDTIVLKITYNSLMNITANSPNIVRYYLQQHNTHNKIMKRHLKLESPEVKKEIGENIFHEEGKNEESKNKNEEGKNKYKEESISDEIKQSIHQLEI